MTKVTLRDTDIAASFFVEKLTGKAIVPMLCVVIPLCIAKSAELFFFFILLNF